MALFAPLVMTITSDFNDVENLRLSVFGGKMWLGVLKVMCLGTFLGGFGRAVAENEGVLSLYREPQVTTCSSIPVAEGERGEMVFHLAPSIARTADSLYMYVKKDNDTGQRKLINGSIPTEWMPVKSVVTSAPPERLPRHFKDGWPSEENPDPLSAGTSEKDQPKKRKLPLKRSEPPPPKSRKLTAARILASSRVAPEQDLLSNEESSEESPEQGLLPIEEPSDVKRKCDEEAESTVSQICQTKFSSCKIAKNERVLQLVKSLTSLMLQIRTFSESDFNSFEFRSLQDSLKEIKETLDTNNINSFQNNVEIHISHIENWLCRMGNLHTVAASNSMQDT